MPNEIKTKLPPAAERIYAKQKACAP